MFLSDDGISEPTGIRKRQKLKRYELQREALNATGITHKVQPDGSLVVLCAHVEKMLGGAGDAARERPRQEPDWDAMDRCFPR